MNFSSGISPLLIRFNNLDNQSLCNEELLPVPEESEKTLQ